MIENRPPDPVPEIVASGREITRDDVEMLWSDLISGRNTWRETSQRALALIETVNVPEHIVNWSRFAADLDRFARREMISSVAPGASLAATVG